VASGWGGGVVGWWGGRVVGVESERRKESDRKRKACLDASVEERESERGGGGGHSSLLVNYTFARERHLLLYTCALYHHELGLTLSQSPCALAITHRRECEREHSWTKGIVLAYAR
jgi:hypothetical protein